SAALLLDVEEDLAMDSPVGAGCGQTRILFRPFSPCRTIPHTAADVCTQIGGCTGTPGPAGSLTCLRVRTLPAPPGKPPTGYNRPLPRCLPCRPANPVVSRTSLILANAEQPR